MAPWPTCETGPLEASDADCFALSSARVVLPCDAECLFEVVPATVVVVRGVIAAVFRPGDAVALPPGCEVRDCGAHVVFPGVVDAGARFGECAGAGPRSASDCWEGFERGTRAAAAGGITCTVDLASQDAPLGAANDLRERRRLCEAAGAHADVALAGRVESGGGDVGEAARALAAAGAVAVAAHLTPASRSCRKTTAADLARLLAAFPGGGGGDPLPLLLHAVQLTTEELEASSPFRLLAPGTREDAQSPLMLLPFCQVDDDDDGGGPAAASDAAPPPDDDDWAAPRGPAAATLRAGAAKDRSPDTPATPGGWTRPSRPPPVAVARLGGAAASPAESHCSTPTRRAAPPSEFFRSPKNESEGRSSQTIWEVRPFSEEVELERPPPLPPCGSPKQQSPRPFGSPGERSPRSGYDSPPRSQKRDRSDPFGEKEEGTWVKNLLQAELESYQMSGSATTSEPASGPSTARSPRGGASLLDQVLGFMPRSSSFFGDAFGETSSPPKAPAEPPTPQSPGAAAWRRPSLVVETRGLRGLRASADQRPDSAPPGRGLVVETQGLKGPRASADPRPDSAPPGRGRPSPDSEKREVALEVETAPTVFSRATCPDLRRGNSPARIEAGVVSRRHRPSVDSPPRRRSPRDDPEGWSSTPPGSADAASRATFSQGERRSSPPDGGPTSPRLRRVKALAAGERRSGAGSPLIPLSSLGNLVAEHGRTATPVLEPDASLRPAPGGRSPPQVAAPPPPPPDGRRMSFLDLDARRASPPEAPLRKPNPRRPPAIKIFKENDRHTRRAIRKEYSLYCDGHPSAAGAIGLEAALDAAASLDDGGGASACGLSLHVAKVSTLQTARVLHDAQAHEDACAAAGNRRLFGDLSGSVALYHLTHCEEAVPHGATVHKVSPPIRHEAHRRALWSALQNGTVAVVTSGHAPGDPRGKLRESGDFLRAAHGTLAGANELLLPVLWSAARTNGYGLGALAVWLSFGPAKLLNLAADRGLIDVGFRADFVIFDADRDWTVDASKLQGVDGDVLDGIPEKKREKRLAAACLFHGHECSGKVLATLLRGRLTYREGRFRTAPHGEVVAR